jgi:ApbE family protein
MKAKFLTLFLGGLLLFSCDSKKKTPKYQEFEGIAGTVEYRVKYISTDTTSLKSSVDSIVRVIDNSLSVYNEESILSKINKGYVPTKADEHFKKVYTAASEVWKESEGMYDPTVGIFVKVWGFGGESVQPISDLPTDKLLDSLKRYVGFDKVKIDADGYVKKESQAIQIDLTSVVRGYTVDVIGDFLKKKGIDNYVVKVAGEIKASGKNIIDGKTWVIDVVDPYQLDDNYSEITLKLDNEAVSTDESFRRVWIDGTGKRFVHIINPFTGKPLESEMLSATVVTKSSRQSDSYATMFMLIGLEKSKAFLSKHPEIKALLIYSDKDNKVQSFMTENMKPLLVEHK